MSTDHTDDGPADGSADGSADNPAAPESQRYRVTVDRVACDGVFACLVRDDRFIEDADGLASFDPDTAVEPLARAETAVSAVFADDRIDDARQAAAACPFDAITVEDVSGESP